MSELPHLDLGSDKHKITHGFEYRITLPDGRVETCADGGFTTREDAIFEFRFQLRMWGWTPPRWWQWWRWKDYPRRWPV